MQSLRDSQALVHTRDAELKASTLSPTAAMCLSPFRLVPRVCLTNKLSCALQCAVLGELRQVHTELEELKTQRELGRLRALHELAGVLPTHSATWQQRTRDDTAHGGRPRRAVRL